MEHHNQILFFERRVKELESELVAIHTEHDRMSRESGKYCLESIKSYEKDAFKRGKQSVLKSLRDEVEKLEIPWHGNLINYLTQHTGGSIRHGHIRAVDCSAALHDLHHDWEEVRRKVLDRIDQLLKPTKQDSKEERQLIISCRDCGETMYSPSKMSPAVYCKKCGIKASVAYVKTPHVVLKRRNTKESDLR